MTDAQVLRPLHVYVHFPWCLEKCPYCDFVSFKIDRPSIDHDGYADAIVREVEARRASFGAHAIRSVFFGGGTPSLWEPRAIARVLDSLRRVYPFEGGEGDVEVTTECNPTSLDAARAKELVSAGVNRLSIGVQSLDDVQLKYLGRLHDRSLAERALDAAIASCRRVSADLIFGLPNQSPAIAAEHAAKLVDRGLSHVSAYALTIEPGTRFGELARRGKLPIADDDATADAFLAIESALGARGLRHYEVSNYARPGEESRHNLGYWRGADYLGLGCAAYGFVSHHFDGRAADGVRYRDEVDPAAYIAKTRAMHPVETPSLDDGVTTNVEPLDADTMLRERIMLGLRLADGVDLAAAMRDLGLRDDQVWSPSRVRARDRLVKEGRLAVEGARLRIPSSRRLSTDGVAALLL